MDNSQLLYHNRTLLQCNATALLQVAADALHWDGFLQSTLQASEISKLEHIRLTCLPPFSSTAHLGGRSLP